MATVDILREVSKWRRDVENGTIGGGGGSGVFTEDGNGNIIGGTGAAPSLSSSQPSFIAGVGAGAALTTSDDNIAIGDGALDTTTTGDENIAIGAQAMSGAGPAVAANIAIGKDTLQRLTGITANNVVLGRQAGNAITTGDSNICIGTNALGNTSSAMTGDFNTFIGSSAAAGLGPAGATRNTYVGALGFGDLTSGDRNVGLGTNVADDLDTGSENVFIGNACGANIDSGDNNIVIGETAGPTVNVSDQLFIDNIGAASDTPLIGGDFSNGNVTLRGSIRFTERADHILTPAATFGELWVRNDTPNVLVFTDDAGTDTVLGAGGGGGGGQWELLETNTVSGSPSLIDLTWDETSYSDIRIVLDAIQPASGVAPSFRLQLGDTNGTVIHATAGDYDGIQRLWEGNGVWAALAGTNVVTLAQSASNAAGETINGTIEIEGSRDSDSGAMIIARIHYVNSSSNQRVIETKAFLDDNVKASIDTVRLAFASGNFANTGDIKVYGLAR